MKVCFYAPLEDKTAFRYNQFYAQDLRALEELADEVVLSTRWQEIPWDADAYFIWWWTWAFLPLVKAKLRGRPSAITGVFNLDNPLKGGSYFQRPWFQRALMAAALRLTDTNIFISKFEFDRVPSVLGTRDPRFVPLAIDGNAHPFGTQPREPFLLTICWLHADNPVRKGVDLAIEAHASLLKDRPELELLIAGSMGDAVPRLEARIAELGSGHRVRFLGRVSHEEKVDLLQRCVAYLQPSVFEGFGVAAAEAMACGAPIVATRVGTLPEVLGSRAIFIDERSPQALARGIERALAMVGSQDLKAASDEICAKYTYEARRDGIRHWLTGR